VSAKLPNSDAPETVTTGGSHPLKRLIRSNTTAMADPTKDQDTKPLYDADLPDEESEEEPDESAEAQGDEDEGEFEAAGAAAASGSRRFGFGRGRAQESEGEKHPMGSLRDSHERVRIDDRPSAIYALLCAAALIGVLAVAWVSGVVPQAAGPSLKPLVVPTAQATPSSAASATISAAPTATATAAPTASASASAAPSK
jgi:hypothetical protein